MATQFWKAVGGYLAAVKIRNRWYYVGTTAQELQGVREAVGQMTREQGMPLALAKLWNKYGATVAAMKNHLPHWKEAMAMDKSKKKKVCTCNNSHCLGPDPKRTSVRHRIPGAVVVGCDPLMAPYVTVKAPGRVAHLSPGFQIKHPIVPGQKGDAGVCCDRIVGA